MMFRLMDRVALLFLIFIYLFNAEPYENIAFSLTWLSLKASILISKACLPQSLFVTPLKFIYQNSTSLCICCIY